MPQRTATIESLAMAFEVVNAMQADGLEWGEGYRPLGRQALSQMIQGRMAEAFDDCERSAPWPLPAEERLCRMIRVVSWNVFGREQPWHVPVEMARRGENARVHPAAPPPGP